MLANPTLIKAKPNHLHTHQLEIHRPNSGIVWPLTPNEREGEAHQILCSVALPLIGGDAVQVVTPVAVIARVNFSE